MPMFRMLIFVYLFLPLQAFCCAPAGPKEPPVPSDYSQARCWQYTPCPQPETRYSSHPFGKYIVEQAQDDKGKQIRNMIQRLLTKHHKETWFFKRKSTQELQEVQDACSRSFACNNKAVAKTSIFPCLFKAALARRRLQKSSESSPAIVEKTNFFEDFPTVIQNIIKEYNADEPQCTPSHSFCSPYRYFSFFTDDFVDYISEKNLYAGLLISHVQPGTINIVNPKKLKRDSLLELRSENFTTRIEFDPKDKKNQYLLNMFKSLRPSWQIQRRSWRPIDIELRRQKLTFDATVNIDYSYNPFTRVGYLFFPRITGNNQDPTYSLCLEFGPHYYPHIDLTGVDLYHCQRLPFSTKLWAHRRGAHNIRWAPEELQTIQELKKEYPHSQWPSSDNTYG